MTSKSVQGLLALVIAFGLVLPVADEVSAQGGKVDRWQWVEDELNWQQQFLEDIDTRASKKRTDGERIELFKTISQEVRDRLGNFRESLAEPTSTCRKDILVIDIETALLCEWRDGFMNELVRDIFSKLEKHATFMLEYYAFRDSLSQTNQDALRGLADVEKSGANSSLRILRNVVEIARRTRRENFSIAGLPPE